jgi:hypothetical protein
VRLARVLSNLLVNAVKYSPAGGTITVVIGRAEGAGATLAVRDQGMGIPAADLPHIFERFHRGRWARSPFCPNPWSSTTWWRPCGALWRADQQATARPPMTAGHVRSSGWR